MQTRNYGWKRQNKDPRDYPYCAIGIASNLPKLVDLRDKMPPIYDQQNLGSCTANAIAGVIQYDLSLQNFDFTPSRLFIYYQERAMEDTINEDAGAEIRDGIKSINKVGVCSEMLLPYNPKKFAEKPSEECYKDAEEHRSVIYSSVFQDEQHIKSALNNSFPVVFGFMVKKSFESEKVAISGIYKPKSGEAILGGHAVMLVGYDDAKKMFLVRNSWGASWGQKGYFQMPYSVVLNKKTSGDFWVIETMR